jgi:haloalkane dehalogenase
VSDMDGTALRRPPPALFPFEPRYARVGHHRIHYVEEGEGDPVLFLHGNPTSSYVFRNVLGPVARHAGRRAIAMDLLGFGSSDKPNLRYSCRIHADVIAGFLDALRLDRVALVAEDWGGFLGAHVMTTSPERFETAVFMETWLWPMTYEQDFQRRFVLPFKLMRSPVGGLFSRGLNIMVERLIPEHCPISRESLDHYRASLPGYRARKALGDFPRLLPVGGSPRASHDFAAELQAGLARIRFPVLWLKADPGVVVSVQNPCGLGRIEELSSRLSGLVVRDFGPGYHFLSEEDPGRVALMVGSWLKELRTGAMRPPGETRHGVESTEVG